MKEPNIEEFDMSNMPKLNNKDDEGRVEALPSPDSNVSTSGISQKTNQQNDVQMNKGTNVQTFGVKENRIIKRKSYDVFEDQHIQLKMIATQSGRKLTDLVQEALDLYLSDTNKES